MKAKILVLALALGAAFPALAVDNLYVGARMGSGHSGLTAADVGAPSVNTDNLATQLFAGARIKERCGVEISATDFGYFAPGSAKKAVHGDALTVSGTYTYPLNTNVSVSAHAGLALTRANVASDVSFRIAPTVGLGLQYALTPKVSLSAQWQHIEGVGVSGNTTDALLAGVQYAL